MYEWPPFATKLAEQAVIGSHQLREPFPLAGRAHGRRSRRWVALKTRFCDATVAAGARARPTSSLANFCRPSVRGGFSLFHPKVLPLS